MIINARVITTLAMLTIFAGMSLMAAGYPPKARFLPLLVGIPGTIMCLAQLIIDIRQVLAASGDGPPLDAEAIAQRPREARMFLWLGAFFAGILAFGFLYAAPVLILAFMRLGERESWTASIVAAVATFAVLYLVFVRLLGLFLFEGLITPLILG
ncbi:MAG: tripartite tricarboxylate transporter TctB family protein [Bauldia sp.]